MSVHFINLKKKIFINIIDFKNTVTEVVTMGLIDPKPKNMSNET